MKLLLIILCLSTVAYADVPNGLYLGADDPKVMPPKDGACSDPDLGLKVWRRLKVHVSEDHIQDQLFDEMDVHLQRMIPDKISGGFGDEEVIDAKNVQISSMAIMYNRVGEGGMSLVIKTKEDKTKHAEECTTWITGSVMRKP